MTEPRDTPGVIAPPPLIALTTVIVGIALDWVLPAYFLSLLLSLSERIGIGMVLMAGGGVLAIPAILAFRSVGTHVEPWKPSSALATAGVYAYVRNPMYVGLGLLVSGIGVAFGSDWTLVMLVPAAIVLHIGVVKREERYLEAKFGDEYRRYKARVPRYGCPG